MRSRRLSPLSDLDISRVNQRSRSMPRLRDPQELQISYKPSKLDKVYKQQLKADKNFRYVPRNYSTGFKPTSFVALSRKPFHQDRDDSFGEGSERLTREENKIRFYDSKVPYYRNKYNPFIQNTKSLTAEQLIDEIVFKRDDFKHKYREMFSKNARHNPKLLTARLKLASLEAPKVIRDIYPFVKATERIFNGIKKPEMNLQDLLDELERLR